MLRVCAWCHEVIGPKPPFDLPTITHGICPPCQDAVLRTLPGRPARSVIIVPTVDRELYRYLVRSFAEVPDILVLLDRRRGERRRSFGEAEPERRRGDRRTRSLRPVRPTADVLVG